ncbi:CinA family protein [Caenispirillum salinarum]|uniref:CinA family protein n=1 Tax=Caenispirillum salinarum TaxID=859058 RepID=UPI00385108B5
MSHPGELLDKSLMDLATAVLDACVVARTHLATAESCTGGLIAGCLTAIAGSSGVMDRGFITYSNEAKTEMLGVPAGMIEAHGAVSEPVAEAMAAGARERAHVGVAVSVTGVAGPGGGSEDKPVGTVWIGLAREGKEAYAKRHHFDGDRTAVRKQSIKAALRMVLEELRTDRPHGGD